MPNRDQYYQGYYYTNKRGKYQVYWMKGQPMLFEETKFNEMKKRIDELIEDNAKKIFSDDEF